MSAAKIEARTPPADAPGAASPPALAVDGLTTSLRLGGTWYDAVRDVSFSVQRGETLALVGESGCGKSLTAMTIMGLLPAKIGRLSAGTVNVDGRTISGLPEKAMEKVRGEAIGMIFQEPMSSLNPVLKVGFQIAESLIYHRNMSRKEASARALALMEEVRIPAARQRFSAYPHEFSGGMRQRVMIALAIACSPGALIADEPTTALDVTVQAQVLDLLRGLQNELGLGILLITHNLGVVASNAQRVMVMYGGDVVESAPVATFFAEPRHPYSVALMSAMPRVDRASDDLNPIPGQVPSLQAMPAGCRYQGRCPLRIDKCAERPPLIAVGSDPQHTARCWVKAAPVGDDA
ncbi:ABC transporter ATP-binding protein [Acuticoccus sp. MNP-M23]|uniref:ABC transporter ATP-binding protein n=1 Tax=Acuticoccus sp. MNP-M23 TaxID=3072793 RepID=UPI0028153F27|nr:ABC transporter ATP-binding protein [Acuticoccus sp. MNP-M23]WMS41943.1 ABC transporter ATP-binding protein [Acuticoccus sp. MNP-M23]